MYSVCLTMSKLFVCTKLVRYICDSINSSLNTASAGYTMATKQRNSFLRTKNNQSVIRTYHPAPRSVIHCLVYLDLDFRALQREGIFIPFSPSLCLARHSTVLRDTIKCPSILSNRPRCFWKVITRNVMGVRCGWVGGWGGVGKMLRILESSTASEIYCSLFIRSGSSVF